MPYYCAAVAVVSSGWCMEAHSYLWTNIKHYKTNVLYQYDQLLGIYQKQYFSKSTVKAGNLSQNAFYFICYL